MVMSNYTKPLLVWGTACANWVTGRFTNHTWPQCHRRYFWAQISNMASIRSGNKGSSFIRCHCIYVIFDVQLYLSNVCVHFTHKNGEYACVGTLWPAPCWLLVAAMAYTVQTGHCVSMSADWAASAGALLNTSSYVYIGNTRNKCFLYLYLMFCKKNTYLFVYLHIGFCICFTVFVTTRLLFVVRHV